MNAKASQVTSLTIVYSTVYLDVVQRKHQSSASLAFVRGIHRWPVNSPHKGPVTRKMFPFDDVIMLNEMSLRQPVGYVTRDVRYHVTFRCALRNDYERKWSCIYNAGRKRLPNMTYNTWYKNGRQRGKHRKKIIARKNIGTFFSAAPNATGEPIQWFTSVDHL